MAAQGKRRHLLVADSGAGWAGSGVQLGADAQPGADAVTLPGQLARQDTQRLDRPPQRRHRITPLIGLHQRQQRRPQPRIQVSRPLTAPTAPAGPAQRLRPRLQLAGAQRHRRLPHPGGASHHPDPAMPQDPGLSPHQQPALPLIQMREDHPNFAASGPPVPSAMSTPYHNFG